MTDFQQPTTLHPRTLRTSLGLRDRVTLRVYLAPTAFLSYGPISRTFTPSHQNEQRRVRQNETCKRVRSSIRPSRA